MLNFQHSIKFSLVSSQIRNNLTFKLSVYMLLTSYNIIITFMLFCVQEIQLSCAVLEISILQSTIILNSTKFHLTGIGLLGFRLSIDYIHITCKGTYIIMLTH